MAEGDLREMVSYGKGDMWEKTYGGNNRYCDFRNTP